MIQSMLGISIFTWYYLAKFEMFLIDFILPVCITRHQDVLDIIIVVIINIIIIIIVIQ